MKQELWKKISNRYSVSNLGQIYSHRRNIIMKPKKHRDGYLSFSVYDDEGNKKSKLVHRFVATAFIPNPKKKPFINHKNGIKQDNCVNNLEWCTQSENEIHARRTGLKQSTPFGCESYNARLTEKEVREIRKIKGKAQHIIAALYGVSQMCISDVLSRKTYSNII